ncbi:MAG TPA: DUF3313 domain-containing protein [Syntrophorhabdaceae bacterium]|jgi:hypothetical protein
MKKPIMSVILASFVFALCAVSPGHGAEKEFSGFLNDYSQLGPGPKEGAKYRYVKPGVDFTKYKKVMLDGVVFFFAEDSKYKGIDPTELKDLSDQFNQAAAKALGDAYPLVAEAGPDVLRLRVAITKLESSSPGRSVISSVIPVGIAISVVKKAATGSWTGAGKTGMEMEALDSLSNERIAAAVDERPGGKTSSFTKWGSAKEAFEFWAQRLRTVLDKVNGIEPKE